MSKSQTHTPFLAFAKDAADLETLKAFAEAHQWHATCIQQGDIKTATQYLKDNAAPSLLLVEIASAAEAPALLDGLAEVCDASTKVIVIGSINEYSFYCWLTEIGISSYLLKPLTAPMLDAALAKSVEKTSGAGKTEKPLAKTIAVLGARGGVGASTVALNLAGVIAEQSKKKVALADMDAQEGTIALTLDLEPSRGFREALEKPDRVDSLFIDRVMSKPHKYLSILSAEESLQERLAIHENAASALIKEMRDKFDVVVMDIPRYLSPFGRACLAEADNVVVVAELTLASLRDTLRISDLMRESLKMKPPVIVINRKGATKHEMKAGDFEKGVNAQIAHSISFAPDLFMPVSTDIPALKVKTHAAVKPLYQLAEQLVPEAKSSLIVKESKKLGGLFKGKKKDDADDEQKEAS
jgi:pilus assembly protein CpaE